MVRKKRDDFAGKRLLDGAAADFGIIARRGKRVQDIVGPFEDSVVPFAKARREAGKVEGGDDPHFLASQREVNRQEDQVVIHTREAEHRNVRSDEEKEQERRRKKEQEEEEEESREDGEEEDSGPRARMRRINIVI